MTLAFLFILGTIFWSFGSVLLRRLQDLLSRNTIKGILYGRSQCPWCRQTLTASQLIPLLGRLWQKGKCFRCRHPISAFYPILEMCSGLIFVMRWVYFSIDFWLLPTILSPYILLLIWRLLLLLLVRDMNTYQLHLPVFGILLVCGLLLFIVWFSFSVLLYAGVFFAVFLWIYLFGLWYTQIRFGVSQEAFGFGDVLLAPVLGLLIGSHWLLIHGWSSINDSIMMTVLYFVLGSCLIGLLYYFLVVLYYQITKKDSSDTIHESGSPMIPFFPAMIICYWIMVMI